MAAPSLAAYSRVGYAIGTVSTMTTTATRCAAGGAWAGVTAGWALTAALLAGCVVGPDFKTPAAPEVAGYGVTPPATTASTPGLPAGEAQRFDTGADIVADWWTLFHSQPLDDLIRRSLANNPGPEGGAGGADGGQGKRAGPTRRVLSHCGSRLRSQPAEAVAGPGADAQQQRLSVQPVHAPGQRFLCARHIRPEPPQHRDGQGAGTGRPLPDDRRASHLGRQCGGGPRSRTLPCGRRSRRRAS